MLLGSIEKVEMSPSMGSGGLYPFNFRGNASSSGKGNLGPENSEKEQE